MESNRSPKETKTPETTTSTVEEKAGVSDIKNSDSLIITSTEDIMNDSQNFITNTDDIFKKSGIPRAHFEALQELAAETGVFISFRPISPYARFFLEEGYSTKPFAVKGKSDKPFTIEGNPPTGGVGTGMIPIDPSYLPPPKPGQTRDQQRAKHAYELKHAFELDAALEKVPLILSAERLDQLVELKALTQTPMSNGNILLKWINGDLKEETAIAKQNTTGSYNIEQDGKPFQVLGRRLPDGRAFPLTADYDLFLVGFPYKDFDPTVDKPEHRVQRLISQARASISYDNREDEKGGNVPYRIKNEVLDLINNQVATFDEKRAVPGTGVSPDDKKTGAHYQATWKTVSNYTLQLYNLDDLSVETLDKVSVPALIHSNDQYYVYGLDKEEGGGVQLTEVKTPASTPIDFKKTSVTLTREHPLYQEIVKKEADMSITMGSSSMKKPTGLSSMVPGLEVVHHNPEMYNPFADKLKDNLPILAFIPGKDGCIPCLVKTEAGAIALRSYLQEQGIYFPSHGDYKKQFSPFRTPITDADLARVVAADHKRKADEKEVVLDTKSESSFVPHAFQRKLNAINRKIEQIASTPDLFTKKLHVEGLQVLLKDAMADPRLSAGKTAELIGTIEIFEAALSSSTDNITKDITARLARSRFDLENYLKKITDEQKTAERASTPVVTSQEEKQIPPTLVTEVRTPQVMERPVTPPTPVKEEKTLVMKKEEKVQATVSPDREAKSTAAISDTDIDHALVGGRIAESRHERGRKKLIDIVDSLIIYFPNFSGNYPITDEMKKKEFGASLTKFNQFYAMCESKNNKNNNENKEVFVDPEGMKYLANLKQIFETIAKNSGIAIIAPEPTKPLRIHTRQPTLAGLLGKSWITTPTPRAKSSSPDVTTDDKTPLAPTSPKTPTTARKGTIGSFLSNMISSPTSPTPKAEDSPLSPTSSSSPEGAPSPEDEQQNRGKSLFSFGKKPKSE